MANLLEVVFEGICKNDVVQLLLRLVPNIENIVNVQCTEDIELLGEQGLNIKSLGSTLNIDGNLSVLIELKNMKAGELSLCDVLLRIVKYEGAFDIDFNFDIGKQKNKDVVLVMKSLHNFAKDIAADFKISNFFGGIEPASDKSSRYFSGP
jgi:predicted CopG family antitoxin